MRRSGPGFLAEGPRPLEAVGVLALWVALELVLGALVPRPASPARALAWAGVLRASETVVLGLWWRARGWTLAGLGLRGPAGRQGLVAGVKVSLGLALAVAAVEAAARLTTGTSALAALAGRPARGAELAALLAVGVAVGPLFEEILFRGVLYGGLRKRWGPAAATGVVTLLFALAHLGTTPVPWTQALGGILFCAAYEVSGSLWAPLIVHGAGNLALFMLPLWGVW